ncbi:unnamed protein product [Acanthoscelides obtectus]|nr:unnamed protein product [Acanthoscelides obtectus]CAK1662795.1 Protein penguin [Acanthoscelides obtectus]
MLQSKYGVFCVKRLLKYGTTEVRSQTINAMLGHAVKLTSHAVSAPVVEYVFSTWATPTQKQYLVQEFYGDLYKNSKDNNVKHIRDVYKTDESLKAATLGAVKTNLTKILNKSLLDSGIVQTVLSQYLTECSEDDKKEMIAQLVPHIVVISNSKDGAKSAMQCIWHGSNKDRKVVMKTLKEHLIDLSKHEHGHATVICLLDSIDDTVLLHKIILSELLTSVKDLALSEWGRKVLLWLVAPADTTYFHPIFVKELTEGREASSCKKSAENRRKEILQYSLTTLLDMVSEDAEFWLSNASLATEMNAIIKAGSGEELQNAYKSLVEVIIKPEWKIKESENKEILGVEHAGIHMILKKITQHDKSNSTSCDSTFGYILSEKLNSEILSTWLNSNRGCFFIVAVFENGSEETQKQLRSKLKKHVKLLKTLETPGAKVLVKILGCT